MTSRGSWRPVLVWAVIILIATSLPVSSMAMRSPVPRLDKVVHAALYGVLGWLVGSMLHGSGMRGWRVVLAGLLGIAAFGAVDEAHQYWLPGRVTSISDWIADLVGASAGLAGGTWMRRMPPRDRADEREDETRGG